MEYQEEKNNILKSCAGKVSILHNCKISTGFIVKESSKFWTVKLTTNEVIVLKRLKYNDEYGGYIYDNYKHPNDWKITCYWPICMKFKMYSQHNWQFLISRIALRNNKIVVQLSS